MRLGALWRHNDIMIRRIMLKMDYDILNVHFSYFIYLQSSTNTKLSSCFEYRELMIVSKYVVGGGLWRLLYINLSITSTRPLQSICSLFWLYVWYHYVYIHNLCTFYDSFQVMKFISNYINRQIQSTTGEKLSACSPSSTR